MLLSFYVLSCAISQRADCVKPENRNADETALSLQASPDLPLQVATSASVAQQNGHERVEQTGNLLGPFSFWFLVSAQFLEVLSGVKQSSERDGACNCTSAQQHTADPDSSLGAARSFRKNHQVQLRPVHEGSANVRFAASSFQRAPMST